MANREWDYIVIGAGSAGCVTAARLGDAGHRVMVLEAGGSEKATPWLSIPIGVGKILQDERFVWKFYTEPEAGAGARKMYWPRGKVVGGSSGVNGMIWACGEPEQYDAWARNGCPGWSWSDMGPVLRRLENTRAFGNARGQDGPISIEELQPNDGLTEAFLDACAATGIARTSDYNALPFEGAGRLQMSTRRGVRFSMARAFLRPAIKRGNVHLEQPALAERILFTGKRATGVRYALGSEVRDAQARFGVIVAAGAVQSPQLLEVSGVGQGRHLQSLGIPVVADLRGVGENLSDHFHIRVTWRSKGVVTFNELRSRPWLHGPAAGLEYLLRGTGPMSYISATAHALARSAPGLPRPDIKIQIHKVSMADRSDYRSGTGVDPFPGISIGYFQMFPESRGSIHARTPNMSDPPKIVANYLATEVDRQVALRGLHMSRAIAAQPQMQRYIVEETRPGPSIASDAALLEYARRNGQTSYHPVGTCKMGQGPDAVVDNECRVHRVDGLRVIDASVIPHLVSSNTNAPAIAVGEKGADYILKAMNRRLAAAG